jgi:hypothetical protein
MVVKGRSKLTREMYAPGPNACDGGTKRKQSSSAAARDARRVLRAGERELPISLLLLRRALLQSFGSNLVRP